MYDNGEVIDHAGPELGENAGENVIPASQAEGISDGQAPGSLTGVPEHLVDAARQDAEAALSKNTRRAYAADWKSFLAWCTQTQQAPMPAAPQTVALYAEALADGGRASASIRRAMITISRAHKLAGHEPPTSDPHVQAVLSGLRKRLGTAQRQAKPLLPEHIRAGLYAEPATSLRDLRDRAVIGIGFLGGFRRSEIVALDVEDVEFEERGVILTLGRGKTDQEGHGWKKAIPFGKTEETCPVRALKAWLDRSQTLHGPVFREITVNEVLTERRMSDHAVDRLVKKIAKAAGLESSKYSGHSLRAGFVTTAHLMGKSDDRIMDMTGHRSQKTLRGYKRIADLFVNNAAEGLGL